MSSVITDLEDVYKKEEEMKEIKVDAVNWVTYYLDERTGEKWIEERIHPEMHGGRFTTTETIGKIPLGISNIMAPTIITGEEFNAKRDKLKLIKQLNWENYYIDEQTREKWIEEYPHSEMHGGDLPQLHLLDKFPWE